MGEIGQCHICLKTGKLSAEHIPPRCCGNKKPVMMTYEFEYERNGRREKVSQNGSKFYTICESCNNGLLADYDNALGSLYNKVYCHFHNGRSNEPFDVTCKINKVARSVIGKFLGLSVIVDKLSFENKLRDYVTDGSQKGIPGMRLTLRLYPYDTYFFARNILPMGKEHFCQLIDCLYFDPFAFMLVKDMQTTDGFERIQKDDYRFMDLFELATDNIEDEVTLHFDFHSIYDKFSGQLLPYNFPVNAALVSAISGSGTAQLAYPYAKE